MHKLRIRSALGMAWSHFTRRGWYLFGLTAAFVGISILVAGEAAFAALALILAGGYILVLFKHARNEHVVLDDMFTIDSRWIYFAFGSAVKGVLVMLGFMVCIVPGLYLASRWMFSEFYILEKGMRPIEALRASSKLTEGYRWKLVWYLLVSIIISLASILCFVVGFFVAIPWLTLTTIMLYWRLQEIQYLKSQE